jgi:zinc protease
MMMISIFDQLAVTLDARAGLALAGLGVAMAVAVALDGARASPRVVEFTLANGLQVLVIPDHRAPVVTQMVWYKVGAADEPRGSSGIAHFLEHLMFKGTDTIPPGQFSKIVARNGGEDNGGRPHGQSSHKRRGRDHGAKSDSRGAP